MTKQIRTQKVRVSNFFFGDAHDGTGDESAITRNAKYKTYRL